MGYAYIPVDLRIMPDAIEKDAEGHWDGDTWVEPERRFNLAALRDALHLPESWAFRKKPFAAVWVDHVYGLLNIGLESADFPDVPQGEMVPRISPMFRRGYWEETDTYLTTFVAFDMREVDAARERAKAVARR